VSAATEQVEEKAVEGTEAVEKTVDEAKAASDAAVEEPVMKKPRKAAIEGC